MKLPTRPEWEKEWSFGSDLARGRAVIEEILRQVETLGWESAPKFGIHLALEESVTNAIRHGNSLDPNKTVRISCQLSQDHIRLEIEDEGPGFNPQSVPDCTCCENLEKSSGRGLFLIQSYMDLVCYEGRGNRLVLEKRRPGR